MTRIVVVGGPRCGKTTWATACGVRPVLHTDDLIADFAWSQASDMVAQWLERPGPWVVEGVAAVRGLRKWLERHPTGKPCDRVVALFVPHVPRNPGQEVMHKGVLTIWSEVAAELGRRGVLLP